MEKYSDDQLLRRAWVCLTLAIVPIIIVLVILAGLTIWPALQGTSTQSEAAPNWLIVLAILALTLLAWGLYRNVQYLREIKKRIRSVL